MIDRRMLLAGGAALPLLPGCAIEPPAGSVSAGSGMRLPALFDDIEKRTFDFFWETVNRDNGLVPDRWPAPPFSSIAAIGFALTVYPYGVERGWVDRAAARDLTLTTLRFFDRSRQGEAAAGVTGHRGFYYHFLDMRTGERFRQVELSTVDTALLHMGILFAVAWWTGDDAAEREIRALGTSLVDRADWVWARNDRGTISMGWHPETGFIERSWDGYNEAMMLVLLALGSGGHPLDDGGWDAWTRTYPSFWRGSGETRHLAFAPLFGHQYSHVWIDFRGIQDAVMREAGLDYFENSRRATYANRAYCIANPMRWDGYSRDIWGLTACDGPGNHRLPFKGETRTFYGYAARGPLGQPDERDDGTIAPTAALGSLPFAPEICVPAGEAMHRVPGLYDRYGFLDSFNPSFRYGDAALEQGTVDATSGWVAGHYLGIDQGPILLQIANHRSDFVWATMRRSVNIRRGLERAGFTGGWLEEA